VVLNSLAFILGFPLVFVSLGASASFLGGLFLEYRNTIRILGGVFILLVGIYLIGPFKIAALERYLQFNLKDKPAGYLGSILVGINHIRCRLDPVRGADLGSHTGTREYRRRSRPWDDVADQLCRGPRPAIFSERAGDQFFLSIFPAARRYVQAIHTAGGILLIIVGILLITDYMTYLMLMFCASRRTGYCNDFNSDSASLV
jgi:cytochrome c-type biogenesis protein